jgi:hypothetical protein
MPLFRHPAGGKGAARLHVVLPQGLDPHHVTPHHSHHLRRDAWHQWEGLVLVLVLVHLLALAFWASLLYSTRANRQGRAGSGSGAAASKRGAAAAAGSAAAAGAAQPQKWRTPRDVLLSYQKARLGKV